MEIVLFDFAILLLDRLLPNNIRIIAFQTYIFNNVSLSYMCMYIIFKGWSCLWAIIIRLFCVEDSTLLIKRMKKNIWKSNNNIWTSIKHFFHICTINYHRMEVPYSQVIQALTWESHPFSLAVISNLIWMCIHLRWWWTII